MTIDRKRLERLLSPGSAAFVGGSIAGMAIQRSKEIGFAGNLWPVNPRTRQIADHDCFASLDELPGIPDALFVGVNRELTIETVRQASEMGVGGCVCYAAGFAEVGGEGVALQEQLVEAAGDMPLIGPNCFGFINLADRCALWPYLFGSQPCSNGVALISQSGNIAMNLTMNDRSVDFTHVIGAGNQANLGPADYVNALLEDDRVRAIGMYIEGFDDVNAFALAAQRAKKKGVPIVVMKVGKTEASAQQASSHTSSLTGSDILYDVFFARLGVVRVDSLNRLLETLKILHLGKVSTGNEIVTLSCSGGEAATIADLAPELGLATPAFSATRKTELEAQFPNYVTVSNPFDYNTSIWGRYPELERCFTTSLSDSHDAAFLVYDHPTVESPEVDEWVAALDAFAAAHQKTGKPAYVICTVSELLPEPIRQRALAAGVIPLQGLEDGLYAYAAATQYHQHPVAVTLPRCAEPVAAATRVVINEVESKALLAGAGVAIPKAEVAQVEEAGAAAERIGFPVVLKAVGAGLVHKSDLGAVRLNLDTVNSVNAAAKDIVATCATHGKTVNTLLVESMQTEVIAEVIVGVNRDAQFGPALVIGSGGILVELLQDSVSLLLPTDRDSIEAAVKCLSVYKIISGFRGNPAGDMDALLDAILAIAGMAETRWDTLLELDVNPLLVLKDGAVAVDAYLVEAGQTS